MNDEVRAICTSYRKMNEIGSACSVVAKYISAEELIDIVRVVSLSSHHCGPHRDRYLNTLEASINEDKKYD